MKALFVSNLFPDASDPLRGQDNAVLLNHLRDGISWRVVSPRPVLLSPSRRRTALERDAGFEPRYPSCRYVPGVGTPWNYLLMRGVLRKELRRLAAEFPFDVVLCSWLYPDGCAVADLCREMEVPFVLIAQGTDVHGYLRRPMRRRLILRAVKASRAVVTRSGDLADRLVEAGADAAKVRPVYNGIDGKVFHPGDRAGARAELGFAGEDRILLYVGNLLPVKNPLLLVRAFARARERERASGGRLRLVMIGEGPLRDSVAREAASLGCADAVSLEGRKSPAEVARRMQAADLLCLSSRNEGVPNVVLEAFGCGLPVVATSVGGIPEVLAEPFLGELVEEGDELSLAGGILRRLENGGPGVRGAVAAHGAGFSWEKCASAYRELLA